MSYYQNQNSGITGTEVSPAIGQNYTHERNIAYDARYLEYCEKRGRAKKALLSLPAGAAVMLLILLFAGFFKDIDQYPDYIAMIIVMACAGALFGPGWNFITNIIGRLAGGSVLFIIIFFILKTIASFFVSIAIGPFILLYSIGVLLQRPEPNTGDPIQDEVLLTQHHKRKNVINIITVGLGIMLSIPGFLYVLSMFGVTFPWLPWLSG